MSDRYWIDHCIGIARDAGNVDAAKDATDEIERLAAENEALRQRVAELEVESNKHYAMAVAVFYSGKADDVTEPQIRAAAAQIQATIDAMKSA